MADPIVTLNGITLHPPAADGTGYSLEDQNGTSGLDGWYGAPTMKSTFVARPSGHGSYAGPSDGDVRVVTASGTLVAATSAGLLQAQEQLAAICPDRTLLYTLQVIDDNGTRVASVKRTGAVLIKPISQLAAGFSFVVTAPDPYKYDPNAVTGSTPLASAASGLDFVTGGGLDFVTGGGLNFGTVTSTGAFTLTNSGTAPSAPTWTLQGPLTNPTITNAATGQQLAYTGSLGASDTVVITTNPLVGRTVILNGSTDRRPYLTTAQWFSVPAGTSVTVQLSSTNPGDTGTLAGSILPAYW